MSATVRTPSSPGSCTATVAATTAMIMAKLARRGAFDQNDQRDRAEADRQRRAMHLRKVKQ